MSQVGLHIYGNTYILLQIHLHQEKQNKTKRRLGLNIAFPFSINYMCKISICHICHCVVFSSGITRGGRVAHPWKLLGKFWKEGERRKKLREREKEEEREKRGKEKGKWKMERKRRGIVKGEEENYLIWKGERHENEQTEDFLLFLFLLVTFWNHWNLFGV